MPDRGAARAIIGSVVAPASSRGFGGDSGGNSAIQSRLSVNLAIPPGLPRGNGSCASSPPRSVMEQHRGQHDPATLVRSPGMGAISRGSGDYARAQRDWTESMIQRLPARTRPKGPLPRLRARCLVADLRHERGGAGAGRIGLGAVELHAALIELKALLLKFVERLVERATVHAGPEVADAGVQRAECRAGISRARSPPPLFRAPRAKEAAVRAQAPALVPATPPVRAQAKTESAARDRSAAGWW